MSNSGIKIDHMNMLAMTLKKEENSYNFYTRAQNMAKLKNIKDLFEELAGEELKHKEIVQGYIEKLKAEGTEWNPAEDLETDEIGYSKYLIATELTEDTSYQDALIIAMKREERAYIMFNNFYRITKDDDLKDLFKRLMNDEINHLKKVEARYDKDVMSDN
ncbi:MAG: ferritin family protein [Thermoplasmata archaeon]|nr:MAG: ferritin family protein [Thermoplasmata archaeon]